MATDKTATLAPTSAEEAAAKLAEIAAEGGSALPVGGGTKLGWAADSVAGEPHVRLSSAGMGRLLEHNEGDFTAVIEAGMKLAEAQRAFAEAGQMLAWDPPLGISPDDQPEATVGGIVASADSGPMRHRFGGVRDTVIGATVVLSDGLVATSGGKVIKNVAGYDLAKLFVGSFGTLGLIASVVVRLHPRPSGFVTVVASFSVAGDLVAAGLEAARHPLELEALDLRWQSGRGDLLLRFAGATARQRAVSYAAKLADSDAVELVDDGVEEEAIWERQRYAQRSPQGAVLKVSTLPSELERVIGVADRSGASLVARAALGLAWLNFPAGDDLAERAGGALAELGPGRGILPLDGAASAGLAWPQLEPALVELSGRLKRRLDPAGVFRPGAMAGVGL